ncbi:MAG: hypothetical protein ACP5GY_08515 [Vulcanisaeta sp.]
MDLSLGEEILIVLREYGPLTAEEIANYLRRDIREVNEELQYLELDRFITRVKKGVFRRREAYELTPTGLEEALKAYEKLRAKSQELINKINSLSPEELEELMNQFSSIIPLLLLLNLIPLELLMLLGLDMLLIGPVVIHDH